MQKKPHGHQHGRVCPSSSPCNVRVNFVQEEAIRKQGECLRWRICPTLQNDMEVDFKEARKKKKKS